ncbi:GNAT family N-acetyltransferase [Phenylobacterium sp.]|uniref:GNAT family N-acetyltransferase n=1 Tax=Phenylobacterium sp. TaxID=1871053 RepID=UPI002FE31746
MSDRSSDPGAAVIRPATHADAAALGRLGALLVRVHHDFDAARFITPTPGTEAGYARFLASRIGQPDSLVLAAEVGGEVAGYCYAELEGADFMSLRGPAGMIYDLLVDPDHRGGGLGRRLLEAMRAALVERGATQVVLSTAERNTLAQKLFAAAGFRRTMIEMTWDAPERD